MESIKSYLVDGGGSGNSDLATMLAMNGGGMNGMWNNPLWAIVFLAALGNGNLFGNGNWGCRNGNANVDFVSSQLGNAIAGNANAISNLATQLNCSEAQVQNTLTNMMTGISTLANTLGQSTLGIQNAINSGNNGVVISESREAMAGEVDAMLRSSQLILDSIDYHKGVVASCDGILKDLNPQYAKNKENEERLAGMEDKITALGKNMEEMMTIVRSLSPKTRKE